MSTLIDIPAADPEDVVAFADWAELNALLRPDGTISAAEIADAVSDRSLLGTAPEELYSEDESDFRTDYDFSLDDEIDRFAQEVIEHLKERAKSLGANYPFSVGEHIIERAVASLADAASYSFMVLIALLPHYERSVSLTRVRKGRKSYQELFEKVVQAAQGRLMGPGRTARFGWPREAHYPTGFVDRLNTFAAEMGLLVSRHDAWDGVIGGNDAGLDLASRLSFGDLYPGSLHLITQCATGAHWQDKTNEPPDYVWRQLLHWDAPVVRGIALPFWLPDAISYQRVHVHFGGAMVLDRRRIMSGQPDLAILPNTRNAMLEWVDAQSRRFPPR